MCPSFLSATGYAGSFSPVLRPDIAVLLQPDLFNTNIEDVLSYIGSKVDESWTRPVQELLELPLEVRHQRQENMEFDRSAYRTAGEEFCGAIPGDR